MSHSITHESATIRISTHTEYPIEALTCTLVGMDALLSHPYRLAFSGILVCLLIAGVFFINTIEGEGPVRTGTWTSGAFSLNPIGYGAPSERGLSDEERAALILQEQLRQAGSFTYGAPATTESSGVPSSEEAFDFAAFIAAISGDTSVRVEGRAAPQESLFQNLYTFIPRGLIAVETPPARTALQQELYAYGNRFGSEVRGFEDSHMDGIQILKDQAEDRGNSEKASAAIRYAEDLARLGKDLEELASVPTLAKSFHAKLAASYVETGTKLALIPKTKTDAEFLAAIETYNRSMDVFTNNYVALVQFFIAHGVSFSPSDPGSIFSFTAPTSFGSF